MTKAFSRTQGALIGAAALLLAIGVVAYVRASARSVEAPPPQVLRLSPDGWRVAKRLKDEYLSSDRVHREIRLRPQTGKSPEEVVSLSIDSIDEHSPLFSAGFRKGDMILEFNGTPVATLKRAIGLIQEVRESSSVTARIQRDGKIIQFRCDFP
jgi:hypothetical protein